MERKNYLQENLHEEVLAASFSKRPELEMFLMTAEELEAQQSAPSFQREQDEHRELQAS